MPDGDIRRFLTAFTLGAVVLLGPLIGLAARLTALGEIEIGPGASDARALKGTLFADTPVQQLRQVTQRRPEVLVLGSSRVGALRTGMFAACDRKPECFYNATGAMPTIRTGLEFIRALGADRAPKLLILGIDVWDLDPNHLRVVGEGAQPLRRDLRGQLDRALAVTRSAAGLMVSDAGIRDVILGRTAVPADAAGLAAILHRTGYRPDGSVEYSRSTWEEALAQPELARSADYVRAVRIGAFEFEPFEDADPQALRDLEQLLDLATAQGTKVVAFTPPFSDPVAALMRAQPHYADGLADAYAELGRVFSGRGIPFKTGLALAEYGCGPDEHLDGIHVSEICAARILISLAGATGGRDMFGTYLDASDLARRIGARVSPFLLP